MKINSDQLPQQLHKHPGFWLASDEIFLQQVCADLIRAHAKKTGFLSRRVFYIDSHFNWDEVLQQLENRSLFDDRQLIELRFIQDKFSDPDRKALAHCLSKLNEDILLLILSHKIEAQTQKAKWFEEIVKTLCFVPIWPIAPHQYLPWLKNRAQQYHLNIDQAGLQLLSQQTQGNTLAADQILQQLQLLYASGHCERSEAIQAREPGLPRYARNDSAAETISVNREMIADVTHNAMQTDLFTFVDVFLTAQSDNAFKHLQLLKAQNVEPILIVWALARELRTLNSLLVPGNTPPYIWPQRQALMNTACKHFSVKKIHALIQQLAMIDLHIKGIKPGDPWLDLERFILC